MALRINFARPAGSELQRILLELLQYMIHQLEQCRDALPVESVHEARKTSKKIRALLSLASSSVSHRQQRRWRVSLRGAAANLARQRDRTVLVETLKRAYRALFPHLDPTTSPWLQLTLLRQFAQDATGGGNDAGAIQALAEVRDIHAMIARATWGDLTHTQLLRLHVRAFRRARKLFDSLNEKRDAKQMHEWRKQVKVHLYQMRFLVNLSPKTLRADAVEFYQLAELLGEYNDLSNLKDAIARSRATFLPIVELPGLKPWVQTRMDALEQDAMQLGRRLFLEQPKSRNARLRRLLQSRSDTANVADTNEGPVSSIPPRQSTGTTRIREILR